MDDFQLKGSAAEAYETQKVPAMFGPLADAMLDAVEITKEDRVLDVACGTGVVGRRLRDRVGMPARLAGVDLNAGMIAVAQSLTEADFEWAVGPADALPFEDGGFTKVFCQQGLQFFPDAEAALAEMRRVLGPGGEAVFSIWKAPSPFFQVLSQAIRDHVDGETATRSLAPFSYTGHDAMAEKVARAGFSGLERDSLTVDRVIGPPETAIEQEIRGNPVGARIDAAGASVMAAIVAQTAEGLPDYLIDGQLVVPQTAYLYRATVG